ncbi:unnamed protein product [Arctogadus glacialis]
MVSESVTAAQLLRLLCRRSGDDKGSAGMCCSSDVGQPVSHSAEGRCSTVRNLVLDPLWIGVKAVGFAMKTPVPRPVSTSSTAPRSPCANLGWNATLETPEVTGVSVSLTALQRCGLCGYACFPPSLRPALTHTRL